MVTAGTIAHAVARVTRLQDLADNDREVMGCDFHRRWNLFAICDVRTNYAHEQATNRDAAVKRGSAWPERFPVPEWAFDPWFAMDQGRDAWWGFDPWAFESIEEALDAIRGGEGWVSIRGYLGPVWLSAVDDDDDERRDPLLSEMVETEVNALIDERRPATVLHTTTMPLEYSIWGA